MRTYTWELPQRLLNTRRWFVALLAAFVAALSLATTAQAAQPPQAACTRPTPTTLHCELWARSSAPGAFTPTGGSPLTVWGYTDNSAGVIAMPGGPTIVANEGDVVEVVLHNDLPGEVTSLALHGQTLAADTLGVAFGADNSAAPYTFTATRPGTFLYEAGMSQNGARQVAMGLYGALVVQPTAAPTAYAAETVLVLSEIDPALNAAPTTFDMTDYQPRYWLINGQAYSSADVPLDVASASTLLVRYVNAGLNENAMGLLGLTQEVVAKDGFGFPSYRVVAETLAPGGTLDALVSIPAAAAPGTRYALYSTAQHLDNNGGAGYGGQLMFIAAVDATGPTTSGVATSGPTDGSVDVFLSAFIDDTASGASNIAAAEYFLDVVGADGAGVSMAGAFSGPTDTATATLLAADVFALTPGDHTLYVHGRDAAGNWGAPVGVTFTR